MATNLAKEFPLFEREKKCIYCNDFENCENESKLFSHLEMWKHNNFVSLCYSYCQGQKPGNCPDSVIIASHSCEWNC